MRTVQVYCKFPQSTATSFASEGLLYYYCTCTVRRTGTEYLYSTVQYVHSTEYSSLLCTVVLAFGVINSHYSNRRRETWMGHGVRRRRHVGLRCVACSGRDVP